MSIKLMSTIWEKKLGSTQKLILLALADSASDEGVCWPSIATIARKTGLKNRAIYNHLKKFEDAGIVLREARTHKNGRSTSNLYCVQIDQVLLLPNSKSADRVHDMQGEGAPDAGGRVHDMHPSKENHNLETKKEKKEPASAATPKKTYDVFISKLKDIYPGKKGSNKEIEKQISRIKPDEVLQQRILKAIRLQIELKEYELEVNNWTAPWKNLKTWLYNECWTEETTLPSVQETQLQINPNY